jgi:predicted RNA-binding Zn-ribbon protein involved in translation (DUF1610 family)
MTVDSAVANRVSSIDTDFACAACGYNLRGLSQESACPECGTSIERSLAAQPMLVWRPGFRLGVFALVVALAVQKLIEWLLLIYFRFVFLRLQINNEGAMMVFQAATLFPAALLLTRPLPLGRNDPARRRRVILISLTALFILGWLTLVTYFSYSHTATVLLLSGYALGPIAFAICIIAILGPVVDVTVAISNPLPRIIVQAVRWLLGYALLGPALANAVVMFSRVSYIRGANQPFGMYMIDPMLRRWMANWLWFPGNRLTGPMWLAALVVLAHTFYRLSGPLIAAPGEERLPRA